MGLVPRLRSKGYDIEDVHIVDDQDRRGGGLDISSFERVMKGRYFLPA